jgi:hypothetical protein
MYNSKTYPFHVLRRMRVSSEELFGVEPRAATCHAVDLREMRQEFRQQLIADGFDLAMPTTAWVLMSERDGYSIGFGQYQKDQ